MTMSIKLVNCFLFCQLFAAWGYDIWHPVDVPLVVCTANGAPGSVTITLDKADIASESQYKPHIFTFFRTSEQATTVTYSAVDSRATVPQVVKGSTTETLQAVSRRMAADDDTGKHQKDASATTAAHDDLLGDLREVEEKDIADAKQHDEHGQDKSDSYVAGRALGKGGGGFRRRRGSSSRRRGPSPSPTPPVSSGRRRGSPTPTPTPTQSGARRRGSPTPTPPPPPPSISARRRGRPAETGSRRRVNGADGKRWGNTGNPQAGAYGYGSPASMTQNYPSGYQTPSYGYTGAGAYQSSSNTNVMMAAGAGAVAGAGSMYMYSRWSNHGYGYYNNNYQCQYGNTWSGSCRDCYSSYNRCERSLPENAARDDLMNTGFIPADFISPIKVVFTSITGADFAASRICPPNGWHPDPAQSNATWTPPAAQDLFLTMTEMTELGDQTGSTSWAPGKGLALQINFLLLFALQSNFLASAS